MLIALKNDIMNLKTYHETNTGTQSSTRNSKEIVKTCRRIHKRKGENLGGVGNRIYNQHREKGMKGIGGGTEGGLMRGGGGIVEYAKIKGRDSRSASILYFEGGGRQREVTLT